MIFEEGGGRIEDTALFGKYQLCRVIGTGRRGTVYLAVHCGLEEYRAIKRIPKGDDYELFRREALILKELRNPGIPIIYDLEEDEEYCYLIEEYLEGETLLSLLKQQGHLSKAKVVSYGIQICRLVNYLHSARPNPILYLDLQPKNLLVCRDVVKLIDFDHAAHIPSANAQQKRYGTVGCAAPEQYTGETLDERTDIYAIGVILYFMLTGTYPGDDARFAGRGWGKDLARIIGVCLSQDRGERFASAEELCRQLESLTGVGTGVFTQDKISSLIIALTGSKSGVGTTHLAIGLSAYLAMNGFPNVYEEKNRSGAVRKLAGFFKEEADGFGLYRVRGCTMKPDYGQAVKLNRHPYEIVIKDYGTNWKLASMEYSDAVILVSGGKWWERDDEKLPCSVLSRQEKVYLAYNLVLDSVWSEPPVDNRRKPTFRIPYFPDPFTPSSQSESFFRLLMETITGKATDAKGGKIPRIWLRRAENYVREKIGGLLE